MNKQIMIITTVKQLESMMVSVYEKMLIKHKETEFNLYDNKLLSAKEAALKLGVCHRTFKSIVLEGKIKPYQYTGLGNPKYQLSEVLQYKNQ